MSNAAALYRLQALELDIIERAKRIKAINAQLEDDAALQEAQAENEEALATLEAAENSVRELELEIAASVDKRQSTEARLYSGEATHPKELQDMQMEVEALARRKSVLDDELLKRKSERDERRSQSDDAAARCNQAREQHELASKELLEEKDTLSASVDQLLAQRKTSVAEIPAEAFQTYNSMRAAKSNRPVAALKDKACAVCGIEQNYIVITAINRGDDLVNCQNCGRILIRL